MGISSLAQVKRSNDAIGLSLPFPDPDEGNRLGPERRFAAAVCFSPRSHRWRTTRGRLGSAGPRRGQLQVGPKQRRDERAMLR